MTKSINSKLSALQIDTVVRGEYREYPKTKKKECLPSVVNMDRTKDLGFAGCVENTSKDMRTGPLVFEAQPSLWLNRLCVSD